MGIKYKGLYVTDTCSSATVNVKINSVKLSNFKIFMNFTDDSVSFIWKTGHCSLVSDIVVLKACMSLDLS